MKKGLYITARTEDWKNFKLFFSLEHQEIEFILSYESILTGIKRDEDYNVVYYEDGEPIIGSKLMIVDEYETNGKTVLEHLSAIHNKTKKDNLLELPIFEINDLKYESK